VEVVEFLENGVLMRCGDGGVGERGGWGLFFLMKRAMGYSFPRFLLVWVVVFGGLVGWWCCWILWCDLCYLYSSKFSPLFAAMKGCLALSSDVCRRTVSVC
jgi:hypothetical protein